MIFAHTLALVLGGQKSQTRRPMKLGETFDPAAMRVLRVGKRNAVVYQVGKTYAVQPGRGQKSVARIVLTGLRQEPVAAISLADAQAEGFASPEAYWQAWRTIHGAHADLSKAVWVLEFRVI
jgi:hypothetical protein